MSAYRGRRIDRDTAERLLRGERVGSPAAHDPLADLLAAAAAPGHDGELVGEQAALRAFREARPGPVTQPRRGSMLKPVLAKLVTAKLALAAAATTAVGGGVVVAATTGTLPTPGGSSHSSQPGPSHRPSDRPSGHPSQHPTRAGTDTQGNPAPSPSMVGLCHAFTAGAGDNPGKALDNPAFAVLIRNAGGRDKVSAYCVTVLSEAPGGAPSTHPSGASGEHGRPSDHPTGGPTSHPTEHPTGDTGHGAPTPRPTGTPTHPDH